MRLESLWDFIQPQQVTCLRCRGSYFDRLTHGLCDTCLMHVRSAAQGDLSGTLLHGRDVLDWAAAAYSYGDGVREQVLAIKFHGARRLGEALGHELAAPAGLLPCPPDAIAPVPLHWRRMLSRGYNQSEALARGLAAETGWPVHPQLLKRTRRTRQNAKLSHDERMNNVAGAFSVVGYVRGRRILLVDDVLTTGATTAQCAAELKRAGAAWVGVIAYARAGSGDADDDTELNTSAWRLIV